MGHFGKSAIVSHLLVSAAFAISLEAGGWGGSFGHSSPPQRDSCTIEYDDVWEEKCETVYEDKCTVDYRQVLSTHILCGISNFDHIPKTSNMYLKLTLKVMINFFKCVIY